MIEKFYYIYKCRLQGDRATTRQTNSTTNKLMDNNNHDNKQEQVAQETTTSPQLLSSSPKESLQEITDLNLDLHPCGICGRTFIQKALVKHQQICQKQAVKKRKPFNSLAQRVAGTDLADFHMKTYKKTGHHQTVTPKRSNSIIRNNLQASSGSVGEKCPSCERTFGTKAFERHVEWCKERTLNKTNQPRYNNGGGSGAKSNNLQLAKDRLAARTNYKAPQLHSKSQRQLNKEKYSSSATNNNHQKSASSNKTSSGDDEIRKEVIQKNSKLQSPQPPPEDKNYDPFLIAKQQMQQLILDTTPTITPPPLTRKLSNSRPKTAPSALTSLVTTPQKINFEETPIRTKYTRNHLVPGIDSPPPRPLLQPLKLFNRKSVIDPPITFQDYEIDPNLINSIDNLSIPEDLKSDWGQNGESINLDNHPVDYFCSKIDGGKKMVEEEEELDDVGDEELFNVDDELYAEYKQFEKIYLQEKRQNSSRESTVNGPNKKGGDKIVSLNKGDGVRANGDSAYSSLNRSTSKEYNLNRLNNGGGENNNKDSPLTSSSESDIIIQKPRRSQATTKKSTAIHKSLLNSVSNPQFNRNDNSSPDDDDDDNNRRESIDKNRKMSDSRLPKFCHECGSKYPLDIAKFCVECGAKRLIL